MPLSLDAVGRGERLSGNTALWLLLHLLQAFTAVQPCCSYKARISDLVKYAMCLPQKTIGNNRAREGTMFNSFITEQSYILLYDFMLSQNRYLCLDLKYI